MAYQKAKKRADTLLQQMLPRDVAIALINNKPVEAEFFNQVTIYFRFVTKTDKGVWEIPLGISAFSLKLQYMTYSMTCSMTWSDGQ